jgi:hypothetical protein
LERLFLVRELDFEEVTVDYVCRHRGAVDVGTLDVDVVGCECRGSGCGCGYSMFDVDVGILLDGMSRSELSMGF